MITSVRDVDVAMRKPRRSKFFNSLSIDLARRSDCSQMTHSNEEALFKSIAHLLKQSCYIRKCEEHDHFRSVLGIGGCFLLLALLAVQHSDDKMLTLATPLTKHAEFRIKVTPSSLVSLGVYDTVLWSISLVFHQWFYPMNDFRFHLPVGTQQSHSTPFILSSLITRSRWRRRQLVSWLLSPPLHTELLLPGWIKKEVKQQQEKLTRILLAQIGKKPNN